MERVVSSLQLADKKIFQNPEGEFLPIKDWKGLKVNSKDEVTDIHWDKLFTHKGSLDFKSLPPTLTHFKASGCRLEDPLDLGDLPHSLISLDVEGNQLYGPLHFTNLPKNIEHINLSNNKFVGRATLQNLPSNMGRMLLQGNPFESFSLKGDVPTRLSTIMIDKWQETKIKEPHHFFFMNKKVETNLLEHLPQGHDIGG